MSTAKSFFTLTEPAPTRARAKARATGPAQRARRRAPGVASGTRQGWGALGAEPMARRKGRVERWMDGMSASRFLAVLVVVLVALVGYVGHVYETKRLYTELQQAQRENLRLRLKQNRLRGELDAATAPGVVLDRARALGLEEGIAYGPTIPLDVR